MANPKRFLVLIKSVQKIENTKFKGGSTTPIKIIKQNKHTQLKKQIHCIITFLAMNIMLEVDK